MKLRKITNGYLVRFEIGEELVSGLEQVAKNKKITAAWVNGIGGATKARVGYYNLERKKYVFRHVKDVRELVSLQGNIARVGDEVALHVHAVVTDSNNKPRGGHLKELIVGGTCEVIMQTLDTELTRALDPEIGLPLLSLEKDD